MNNINFDILSLKDDYRIIYNGEQGAYTRNDLYVYSMRFSNLLREINIKCGDHVAIIGFDSYHYIEAFWGCYNIGAVPVMISTLLQPKQMVDYIIQSEAKTVVVSYKIIDLIGELGTVHTIIIDDELNQHNHNCIYWSDAREQATKNFKLQRLDNQSPGFIFFTSGSTGMPKPVICKRVIIPYTQKQLRQDLFQLRERDIVYCTSKMFVIYGMLSSNYGVIESGASSIIDSAFISTDRVVDNIIKYRPSILVSIPSVYNRLLSSNHIKNPSVYNVIKSIRLFVSAGEPLGRDIASAWFNTFGTPILEGLGGTEAGGFYIANKINDVELGSLGYLMEGYNIRFIEPHILSDGSIEGEVEIASENISLGYFNSIIETNRKFHDGWYKTGDILRKDLHGRFWFVCRKDDLMKISGIWMSPFQIEQIIKQIIEVEEVIVSFIGSDSTPKKLCAVVKLKDKEDVSYEYLYNLAHSIYDKVRKMVEHIKCPKIFVFVDDFPHTDSGKIHRKAINAYINNGIDIIRDSIVDLSKE